MAARARTLPPGSCRLRLDVRQKRRARVEMVPLIDMIFLLLVFFMYAMLTMTVHKGVKVDLPEAGSPPPELRKHVTVSIDRNNGLFVDGRSVELAALVPAVESALDAVEQRKVVIDGDRNAQLGVGVQVLEKLSRIRDIKVSFSVKEEQ